MSIVEFFELEAGYHWQDMAACRNIPLVYDGDSVYDPLFDSYEDDTGDYPVRNAVDQMCLTCPVQQICFEFGQKNKETGVFGGFYLADGKIDRVKNSHKTRELAELLLERLSS